MTNAAWNDGSGTRAPKARPWLPTSMEGSAAAVRRSSRCVLLTAMMVAWRIARLALCALLVLVEPLLGMTLVPLAYLGFLVTLFFGFLVGDPRFPKWGMLGLSVGALCLYWLFIGFMVFVMGNGRGRR